ncbi:helix-turn-helix transcriptional regulator [Halothermothrix orenii]|uniref:helix-turn-helix transcriptional regulator n=1 Tax=Halothermothrix orenii TaxID=31909 RepID=UPI00006BAF73|nr:LuxR C-terminal-related transcriptional regulator [Halothermothrix orenii]
MSTISEPLIGELMAIAKLLAYQIRNEMENNKKLYTKVKKIKLSEKQIDVLKLISNGLTEKAIALELEININTTKYHKKIICQKLDVNCGTEAVLKAIQLKLL